MPISNPTKSQLESLKIVRSYGVKDLERYLSKIKKNIAVFEDAIKKEKTEMKRVKGMITALKHDIREASALQKMVK